MLGCALICFLAEKIDTALMSLLLYDKCENLLSLSEVCVELILVCHRKFQEETSVQENVVGAIDKQKKPHALVPESTSYMVALSCFQMVCVRFRFNLKKC